MGSLLKSEVVLISVGHATPPPPHTHLLISQEVQMNMVPLWLFPHLLWAGFIEKLSTSL